MALMDTMTNVVGVLIIVLVLVGIGLADSVRKVLSNLPPVTIEEHAALKNEVDATAPKTDPKQVDVEMARLQQNMKRAEEELATLDVTKEQQNVQVIDLDALRKQLDERKMERDAKKSAVDALLTQVAKLKSALDTTPATNPAPPVAVKLPNPRPLPDKASIQHFLVAGNRITYINGEEYSRAVEQELRKNEATLTQVRETLKGPDGKPLMQPDKFGRLVPQRKVVYDSKKVAAYFAQRNLSNRQMKVEVVPASYTPLIPLKLSPAPDTGETAAQAKTLISNFQTLLRKFKGDPKSVVWFHIFRDSIQTYLAARELTDSLGVPAGWELYGTDYFIQYLPPEFVVEYTAPVAPAPAVLITPPKATLD